jgi:hypothetical protein
MLKTFDTPDQCYGLGSGLGHRSASFCRIRIGSLTLLRKIKHCKLVRLGLKLVKKNQIL